MASTNRFLMTATELLVQATRLWRVAQASAELGLDDVADAGLLEAWAADVRGCWENWHEIIATRCDRPAHAGPRETPGNEQ
jgi:hypothetical protein